ncbi:RNA polymerase sigma factor [Prevotella sp. HUN102]|uniref:RNA polymerase sigma factor n=1 Tax=Prevotella sp. HUN102 TaxID=1392486 RepID=UPI00048C5F50|nr:RNA polymerase sigma factor [Prevotella sp. HUN102]
MSQIEEAELLKLLANPKEQQKAFALLVNQYSQQLYWKIRSFVLSHDDADDVLQNTFLKAWKNIGTFQGKSKISTWLYRIAINESLDFIRHQKPIATVGADQSTGVSNRLLADEYFDGDKGQALLQEAISSLPDVQRTVFLLRYYDEKKYSEIHDILGTSEGALKASYHIAVQKITEYIKKHQ